jgi:nitrogen fixation protein
MIMTNKTKAKTGISPGSLSLSIPKNDLGHSDMLFVALWYGSILTKDGWGL